MTWWRDAVVYQIYPRAWGTLEEIRAGLDYLEWLGVDALWLSPIFPSPNADWGYDVSDYLDVHPDFGTLADLDALVADAHARGMRVLLDLVPNHTSDQHPWFRERPEYYVWADQPNNWRSTFGGGPAWTFREDVGRYYLHNFLPQQPDLDWWREDVRAEFDEILRFWLRRGIDGFRIDVAHALVKERTLRDNPPGDDYAHIDQPEVHEVHRRFRRVADEFGALLIGETWVTDVDKLVRYYGQGDELHLPMYFPFALADFNAASLRGAVERWESHLPDDAWPIWVASNHDIVRFPTRWCGGDAAKIRCALLILLTLRGTPILYYGDELGMEQVDVREEQRKDVAGRDGARTPMPWDEVERQRADAESLLEYTRSLIRLRRELRGGYASVDTPDGVWAWRRGAALVAVNLSDRTTRVEDLVVEPWSGTVVLPE